MKVNILIVVGGGLAGGEAAWQAAEHGVRVALSNAPQHLYPRPDLSAAAAAVYRPR